MAPRGDDRDVVTRPISASASPPPNTAHSTACADASGSASTRFGQLDRLRELVLEQPRRGRDPVDDQDRSPWWVTRRATAPAPRRRFRRRPSTTAGWRFVPHPSAPGRARSSAPGRTSSSVSSASAALPCHSSDRASSSLATSPPPRLTAARASRSPRVTLVRRDRVPGGGHQQLEFGVWSLSIVNSASRIRSAGPCRV